MTDLEDKVFAGEGTKVAACFKLDASMTKQFLNCSSYREKERRMRYMYVE